MKRIVSLILGLSLFLPMSVSAWAQEAAPTAITVNGRQLSPAIVIGSTGNDWAVQVTPILQATGAKVQATKDHVEALWTDNSSLLLEVGRTSCTYNGQQVNLNIPCGSMDNDLVLPLGDLCSIIGARAEMAATGEMTIYRDIIVGGDNLTQYGPAQATGQHFPEAGMGGLTSRVSNANSPYDRPSVSVSSIGTTNYTLETTRSAEDIAATNARASMNPLNPSTSGAGVRGMSVDQFGIPLGMNNAMAGYGGGPMGSSMGAPTSSPMGKSMGGYATNSKMGNLSTPNMSGGMGGGSMSSIAPGMYSNSGMAAALGMGAGATNPLNVQTADEGVRYYPAPEPPASTMQQRYDKNGNPIVPKPSKVTIANFDVQRLMSFHLTAYEVRARIKNEGELATDKPVMVQLMAKSKRYDHYDLLESYIVDPLQPGMEVEVVKKVDGHQFPCLADIRVDFKVTVLESLPVGPGKSARLSRQERAKKAADPNYQENVERSYRETSSKEKHMHY